MCSSTVIAWLTFSNSQRKSRIVSLRFSILCLPASVFVELIPIQVTTRANHLLRDLDVSGGFWVKEGDRHQSIPP